jgi:hypothetical protein
MAGAGGDIKERTPKVLGSDVRNGTRQPVNFSSKNGAIPVSIARIDANAKADARVPIAAPFERASAQAMTGIRMQPAIAIPHRRNIVFDNATDPDSSEFPEDIAHTQSDHRSRSRAIRNAADRPCS